VYQYDDSGNLQAITYDDESIETWTYSAGGDPVTWTNRRGSLIGYEYNTSGQLTAKTYPGKAPIEYEYNERGNLTSYTDAAGMTTLSYDAKDRLQRITYPGERYLEYTYDDAGRRTLCTDQLGHHLGYYYDVVGRLDRIVDANEGEIVRYHYDDAGRLTRKDLGNGVYTTYEYDAAGQLLSLVNYKPDDTILSQYDYTYDNLGRRTSMATLEGTWQYDYDDLGQLTTWTDPSGRRVEYVYDALGNRITVTDDGSITQYTTNNMNQYTQVGDTTYTFDADGSMQSKTDSQGTATYEYDEENRLVSVITPSGNLWEYLYDGGGNRVAVTQNGVTTNYVHDPIGLVDVVGEYSQTGGLTARYVHGYGLASRVDDSGQPAYYSFDALGSTSEVTNKTGSVVNSYTYDTFGIILNRSDAVPNPFTFVGRYGAMHEGHGLVAMRARFYAEDVGRFVTVDPVGLLAGDSNPYTYAWNSPLMRIDPLGLTASGIMKKYMIYAATSVFDLMATTGLSKAKQGLGLLKDYYDWHKTLNNPLPFDMAGPLGIIPSDPDWSEFVPASLKLLLDLLMQLDPTGQSSKLRPLLMNAYTTMLDLLKELGLDIQDLADLPGPPTDPCDPKDPIQPVGTKDPNKKTGPAGYGALGYIAAGSLMPYMIEFENDPNATAPVQIVEIADQLDDDLEWTTFMLTEIAFGDSLVEVPEDTQYFETTVPMTYSDVDFEVHIDAGIHLATGEVYAKFYSVDPVSGLPPVVSVGFLPPEDGTGRGQGHISYIVRSKEDLEPGTEIRNIAEITFDFSETIATNQVDPHDPSKGTDPNMECLNTIAALDYPFLTDPNLKAVIAEVLDITDPMPVHMLALTSLDASDSGISDLTGLQAAANLTRLVLANNAISDINALSELGSLTELDLYVNQVSDISALAGLDNLTRLSLTRNQITDISPLSSLTDLTVLQLSYNSITDINALSGLTNLTELLLEHNHISDVNALCGLTNLTKLNINENNVSNINVLSGLTELQTLHMSWNQIDDVTALSALTKLTNLTMNYNYRLDPEQVTAVVSGLTDLEILGLKAIGPRNNRIKDITELSNLKKLKYLWLNSNEIADVHPLSGLVDMRYLYLNENKITDISDLSQLRRLSILELRENDISCIEALSELRELAVLRLHHNQISDISPLLVLRKLKTLDLRANPLNEDAYSTHLSQIRENNPEIELLFDPLTIMYVDDHASLDGDGRSWTTAYKYLQDALADANSTAKSVQIRVAQGIYTPDSNSTDPNGSGDREATFQLINGVTLKGGYAGLGAPDPNARDVDVYKTVLTGDLNRDDGSNWLSGDENCFHVITGSGTDSTAILDGFTITAGFAGGGDPNDPNEPRAQGGGMRNHRGDPTLTNCTFERNWARHYGGCIYNVQSNPTLISCSFVGSVAVSGGGMYNSQSSPTLTDCHFSGNRTNLFVGRGGGMYNGDGSSPTLVNCTFSGNTSVASAGGGMYNDHSSPTLTNCIFTGNSAPREYTGRGGAMCGRNNSHAALTNCLFIGNQANHSGGAIYDSNDCNLKLTNCTFAGNQAERGNAFGCSNPDDVLPGEAYITNCILWDGGNEVWDRDGSQIRIAYSNIKELKNAVFDPYGGIIWGEGNIDADPCFVEPDEGDYHLRWISPCVDAGDPNNADYSEQVDIDGEPRVMRGRVNMGADEVGKTQADFTRNGTVDFDDVVVFVRSWLSTAEEDRWHGLCDLYENGRIDWVDWAELAEDWRLADQRASD